MFRLSWLGGLINARHTLTHINATTASVTKVLYIFYIINVMYNIDSNVLANT